MNTTVRDVLCPCCKKKTLKLEMPIDVQKPLKYTCGFCGCRVSEELMRKLELAHMQKGTHA